MQTNDMMILESIYDNNMIFVSAQPDTVYFHWQVEIYLYQFSKHGIIDRCYALFGYSGNEPSAYAQELAKKYSGIKFYKDERPPNQYAPSIRPHILAKFFKDHPHLGKNVFYHDSDIFLVKLPRFDLMMQPFDNTSYLSDTISYIGYEYIKECSGRYKAKHPHLPDHDLFTKMCDIVGINEGLVIANQNNSGGAQYLLKNIDSDYWEECERKCLELYPFLCNYEQTYPVPHHIQKWTTDMWVVLWVYWKRGGKTLIHKELDFSWATSSVQEYNRLNIFHLAGITGTNCNDKFHKGLYSSVNVFDEYVKNHTIFDHINVNNATYEYTNVIKEYISKTRNFTPKTLASSTEGYPFQGSNPVYSDVNTPSNNNSNINPIVNQNTRSQSNKITKFRMVLDSPFSDTYIEDQNTQCCGKNIWRSMNNNYIIFWTGVHWILTYSSFESEIGPKCGGIMSTGGDFPYTPSWNRSDVQIILVN